MFVEFLLDFGCEKQLSVWCDSVRLVCGWGYDFPHAEGRITVQGLGVARWTVLEE